MNTNIYKTAARLYQQVMVARSGARHSRADVELLQQVHDRAVELGAVCHCDGAMVEQSKRNYKKEYRDYHGKPEQVKNRSSRNKARRKLEKEGRVKPGDGKDVDHKDGNPKNNSRGNLRVRDKSKNRADNQKANLSDLIARKSNVIH
jgi:hypothetical protein